MKHSEEEKAMWLEDWKASGESAWSYAKKNGLNPVTFKNWTMAETGKCRDLVEIPCTITVETEESTEIIIEKEDVKIRVPMKAGQEGMKMVIESLGLSAGGSK